MKKGYIFAIISILGLSLGFAVSYFLFPSIPKEPVLPEPEPVPEPTKDEIRVYPEITPDTLKTKKIKLPNGNIIEVPAEYILREGESLAYPKPYFPTVQ